MSLSVVRKSPSCTTATPVGSGGSSVPESIEKFLLSDNSGGLFWARIVYTSIEATSQDEAELGERQFVPSAARAELLDGRRLYRIDDNTFQIVATGEILTRQN
jgi:hypothetical protein